MFSWEYSTCLEYSFRSSIMSHSLMEPPSSHFMQSIYMTVSAEQHASITRAYAALSSRLSV